MIPPKVKSTKTLQSAWQEGISPRVWGGGGYSDTFIYTKTWAILGVQILNFNIWGGGGVRKMIFFGWGMRGGGVVKLEILGGHRYNGLFFGLFLNILGLF